MAKDTDECAEQVPVRLELGGGLVGGTTTDNYGDFWFDGLERADHYLLTIESTGYVPHHLDVVLTASINVGSVFLERRDVP